MTKHVQKTLSQTQFLRKQNWGPTEGNRLVPNQVITWRVQEYVSSFQITLTLSFLGDGQLDLCIVDIPWKD